MTNESKSLGVGRPLTAEDASKIEAYDAARATVKVEGNSRAYYVLRAKAAEEAVDALREAVAQLSISLSRLPGGRQELDFLQSHEWWPS